MNVLTFIELGQRSMARLGSPWGFSLDVYKKSLELVTVCCGADFYYNPNTEKTHCVACGTDYAGTAELEHTIWQRDEMERLESVIAAFTGCDVLAASLHAYAAVEDLAMTRAYLELAITLEDLQDETD